MNVRDPALPRTPIVPSRLPSVGTTIFTVMSALAQERGAVNLGQGFRISSATRISSTLSMRRCARASTSTRR
jgi:hypothetical protein